MIVHLELIVGKEVRDNAGRRAGRIIQVHGEEKGKEFLITHYVLVEGYIGFLLHELGATGRRTKRRVPWEQMDLRDPLHPRLLCGVEELDVGRR
ncbi:MAG TPA: hypothetical protein VKB93_17735 [Thermoanaerobaculia bacterium]|nr:hypothetical protein [Thermoanaerobaculia bacterium]